MNNPLENYYRNKEIYIKLPSGGKWYKTKPKLSVSGEIGIMPMTTKDEMILKVPDSLYNGESLFIVIKSVAPDIENPYDVAIPDVDAILIATRAVTQGKDMNVSVKCPNCNEITDYAIDIPSMLSKIKTINDDVEIEIKHLKLKLKPNTLAIMTASSIESVEVARLRKTIVDLEAKNDFENSKKLVEQSLNRIAAANLAVIADMIESVTTPDGTIVTEYTDILQWVQNLDLKSNERIKKAGEHLNVSGIPRTHTFTCSNELCNHTFDASVEINPTFFFTPK